MIINMPDRPNELTLSLEEAQKCFDSSELLTVTMRKVLETTNVKQREKEVCAEINACCKELEILDDKYLVKKFSSMYKGAAFSSRWTRMTMASAITVGATKSVRTCNLGRFEQNIADAMTEELAIETLNYVLREVHDAIMKIIGISVFGALFE